MIQQNKPNDERNERNQESQQGGSLSGSQGCSQGSGFQSGQQMSGKGNQGKSSPYPADVRSQSAMASACTAMHIRARGGARGTNAERRDSP